MAATHCMESVVNATIMYSFEEYEPNLKHFYRVYGPVHRYVGGAICVFGIFCNVANMVVLTRPEMRNSINTLLTGIALSDTCLMLSNFVFLLKFLPWPVNCAKPGNHTKPWVLFFIFYGNFSVYVHTISLWLTVILALLRYVIVRSRTQAGFLSQVPVALVLLAVTSVMVGLTCMPNFFMHVITETSVEEHDNCTEDLLNATYYESAISPSAMANDCLLMRVNFWIGGVLFKIVPCVFLTLFMGLLLHVMFQANQRRRRLLHDQRGSSGGGERTTLLLTLIVLVFLLTELPQGVMTLLSEFYGQAFYMTFYLNLGDFLDLLSLINCCANFVLYCIMSRKFRELFCNVFVPNGLHGFCTCRTANRRWRRMQNTAAATENGQHHTLDHADMSLLPKCQNTATFTTLKTDL